MNKIKIFSLVLAVILIVLLALVILKARHFEVAHQRMAVTRDVKIGLNHLMLDLIQGHQPLVQHLPVDGLWHKRIVMIQRGRSKLEFLMLMRRKRGERNILEVQVEDPNTYASICFFKIRMHH